MPAWLCGLRWWQEIKVTTLDVSFTFTRATGANSFGTPSQLDSLEPEGWIGELLVSNANQQTIGWVSPHPVGQWVTSQPEIINPAALHWASGIQPLRRVALEAASDLGGCRAQLHCHWRHGKSIPPSSPVLAGNKPFWGKEREGLRNRFFFGHAEEREKSGGFHVPLPAGQALYGGGSYQNGLINYKGVPFLQHVAVSMDELTHLPRGKWQIMEKHQKPDLCFFSCQHLDNVFLFLGEGRHIKLPAISEWPSVSYLPEILGDPC